MNEPHELDVENPPCAVTEEEMKGMDKPNPKGWRKVAPEEKAGLLAKIRARRAALEAS